MAQGESLAECHSTLCQQQCVKAKFQIGHCAKFQLSLKFKETFGHHRPFYKLRSHEHCEANYLGRLEIIHFENIVGTRSSCRRISGVDSRSSTPGGGFGDTPYLNSLHIVLWERKTCWLIRFTFYSHAQWGIRDKSLFRLVHYKRSGGWQPHIVVKNKANSPHSWDGDRGSVAFSLLNLLIKRIAQNSGRYSPRSSWHIIMSAPLCCQVQDARHLHFWLAHNQFYPAHAHLSVSCLKRLRVMVVCTRAFIDRNRIKRHGLQSSVYFLFVWMQL